MALPPSMPGDALRRKDAVGPSVEIYGRLTGGLVRFHLVETGAVTSSLRATAPRQFPLRPYNSLHLLLQDLSDLTAIVLNIWSAQVPFVGFLAPFLLETATQAVSL
jgi:hypothetical protein